MHPLFEHTAVAKNYFQLFSLDAFFVAAKAIFITY